MLEIPHFPACHAAAHLNWITHRGSLHNRRQNFSAYMAEQEIDSAGSLPQRTEPKHVSRPNRSSPAGYKRPVSNIIPGLPAVAMDRLV